MSRRDCGILAVDHSPESGLRTLNEASGSIVADKTRPAHLEGEIDIGRSEGVTSGLRQGWQ